MIIRSSERKKSKGVFRSLTIKDNRLNKRPRYYSSMADNPLETRLDLGVDVGRNLLKIEKTLEFEILTVSNSGSKTLTHGLGYKPVVIGTYQIVDSGGLGSDPTLNGKTSIFPDMRSTDWTIGVGAVTNDTITVSVTNSDLNGALLKFKLYILREKTFV